jgi:hypothetical protein
MKLKTAAAAMAAATVVSCACGSQAFAKGKIDSSLFAGFSAADDGTSFTMLVCGSLPGSEGCYGSGFMSGFEHACAVLEGAPKYKPIENGQVVTREIYVLDDRTSRSAPAILYLYKRTDTITGNSSDSVSLQLDTQVTLSFAGGGPKAKCWMAGNDVAVYPGTDKGGASSVDKKTLAVSTIAGPGLTSITADDRGFVAINTTDGNGIINPGGQEVQSGGGNWDMINDRNAWKPN